MPSGFDRGASSGPTSRPSGASCSRAFAEALAGLPHDQQVAFVLWVILEQGLGVEVARALRVPGRGTIWRRLHVARKAVRAALEGNG